MQQPHTPLPQPQRAPAAGFSRIDLLASASTAMLIGALSLSAATHSSIRSKAAVCLNNHKQMARAWFGYAEDRNGRLVGNLDGGAVQSLQSSNLTWALGWLDFTTGSPANANTNTLLLSHYSPLAPYLNRSAAPFLCPADLSLQSPEPRRRHVRSLAMNSYIGDRSGPYTAGYKQIRELSQFTELAPAQAFVFIDEREDSINDAWFPIDMNGHAEQNSKAYRLVDYPSDAHDGAATLSFADGHVESWVWRDARTRPPHQPNSLIALGIATPDNPDVARIHSATARRVR